MKMTSPAGIPRFINSCAWLLMMAIFATVAAAADVSQTALMVVAHGSRDAGWNNRVIQTVEKLDWAGPKAVAFLTSQSPEHELKQVAAQLDQPGIKQIVVVPLLVSSFSGHYEEIRYYAGQRKELPHEAEEESDHEQAAPLKTKSPLLLTVAMDGHQFISRILADEIKPFVKEAGMQSVVLVAHGPNEDSENERWLTHLRAHAERIKEQFGFRRVEVATLRDDAPKPIRDAATERLRATVRAASAESRVLVLPVLISVGHIQKEIQKRLDGLEFTMVEGGLANHPLAAEWVRTQAAQMCATEAKPATTASLRK
jgi:sirohydrochlorin cobaltochelatase